MRIADTFITLSYHKRPRPSKVLIHQVCAKESTMSTTRNQKKNIVTNGNKQIPSTVHGIELILGLKGKSRLVAAAMMN